MATCKYIILLSISTTLCTLYSGVCTVTVLLYTCSPLHNAVLLANSKLVTRYCTVLLALGKSVDIWNKQGLVILQIIMTGSCDS